MLSRIGKFYICFSPQIFLLLSSNRTQAEEFKQKNCDSVQSNNFHFKKASQLQHYSRREDDTGVEEMAKLHEGPVRNRHTHTHGPWAKSMAFTALSLCPRLGSHGGGLNNSSLHSVAQVVLQV